MNVGGSLGNELGEEEYVQNALHELLKELITSGKKIQRTKQTQLQGTMLPVIICQSTSPSETQNKEHRPLLRNILPSAQLMVIFG